VIESETHEHLQTQGTWDINTIAFEDSFSAHIGGVARGWSTVHAPGG